MDRDWGKLTAGAKKGPDWSVEDWGTSCSLDWAGADPTNGCETEGGLGGNDLEGMGRPLEEGLVLSELFLWALPF